MNYNYDAYICGTELWDTDSYILEATFANDAPKDIAENEELLSVLVATNGDVMEPAWPIIAWPELAALYESINGSLESFEAFERELKTHPLYGDEDYELYNWGLRRFLRQNP